MGVQDIEAVDPEYFKNLAWMLGNDITDVLDLTFTEEVDYFGRKELKELKPGRPGGAGHGGQQARVRQPGGHAPHDHRHPRPARRLPRRLLGPHPQGAAQPACYRLLSPYPFIKTLNHKPY